MPVQKKCMHYADILEYYGWRQFLAFVQVEYCDVGLRSGRDSLQSVLCYLSGYADISGNISELQGVSQKDSVFDTR